MLSLDNRSTFIDLLKPDNDWKIERIFGTSLILDVRWLFNLLLALSEFKDKKDKRSDPGQMLAAIRGFRGKVDLFVQMGKISNTKYDILLEEGKHFIHQVHVDENQMFHPKVWVVEYKNNLKISKFKVLVSSRNAVFSTTLESCIAIEGEAEENNFNQNGNLIKFIEQCYHKVEGKTIQAPKNFLDSLKKTTLNIPVNNKEEIFHFQGMDGQAPLRNLFEDKYNEILVFSPFLNVNTIDELRLKCNSFTLVSTQDKLAENLKEHHFNDPPGKKSNYYYVKQFVSEDSEEELEFNRATVNDIPEGVFEFEDKSFYQPGFLHAKMYFLEKKKEKMEMILGSANCTEAGLGGKNIEAVIKIEIPDKDIKTILSSFVKNEKKETNELYPYIEEFQKDQVSLTPISEEEKLRREAHIIFQRLMNGGWSAIYNEGKLTVSFIASQVWNPNIKNFEVRNVKLHRYGNPKHKDAFSEYEFEISDGEIPGELFEFTLSYPGLEEPLSSMAFLAIKNSPKEWGILLEKQILERMETVSSWYLFIFGLLYNDNIYEKAKSQRHVESNSNQELKKNITEIQSFNLEKLLGLGEINQEIAKEIDNALEIFEKKIKEETVEEGYRELYEEIIAFKDLFKLCRDSLT